MEFGEYSHQQAIEDGWLDAQGRLTVAGLQAIVSEQERNKRRGELLKSLKSGGGDGGLRTKKLRLRASSSSKPNTGASSAFRTQQRARLVFVNEVKALLSKIDGKFVHLSGEDSKDYRLVIRTPSEKGGTTSRTFAGTMSDILLELRDFTKEMEEKNK